MRLGTSPEVADTDGDGLPDRVELDNGLNPLVATEASRREPGGLAGVQLKFFTLGLGLYQLQYSLDGADWQNIGSIRSAQRAFPT